MLIFNKIYFNITTLIVYDTRFGTDNQTFLNDFFSPICLGSLSLLNKLIAADVTESSLLLIFVSLLKRANTSSSRIN